MDKKTKLIALGLIAVVIVFGVLVARPWLQNRTVAVTVNEKIERPAFAIAFSFPSGEDAYTYIEPILDTSATTVGPVAAFIMMNAQAYEDFQEMTDGGETPPSMSIFVFNKPIEGTGAIASGTPNIDRITKMRNWAQVNTSITSYERAIGIPEEVTIDGATALHYQADGLYPQDIYIAFNKGKYYLIVGQYDGEADPQYVDFQELVKSITFM